MRIECSKVCLGVLTLIKTMAVFGESNNEGYRLESHGRTLDRYGLFGSGQPSSWQAKQGPEDALLDQPFLGTADVINSTWRVLGAIATFLAFIVIPAFDAVVSTTFSNRFQADILRRRVLRLDGGRSFQARGILDYDNCIELLSCSLSSTTRDRRNDWISSWTEWYLGEPTPGSISSRILKGRQSGSCSEYRCNPVSFIVRLFIYVTDWNTLLKV